MMFHQVTNHFFQIKIKKIKPKKKSLITHIINYNFVTILTPGNYVRLLLHSISLWLLLQKVNLKY